MMLRAADFYYEHLEGSFTAPTVISGTVYIDSIKAPCTDNTVLGADAQGGTWTSTSVTP